jgi:hypothetical protein
MRELSGGGLWEAVAIWGNGGWRVEKRGVPTHHGNMLPGNSFPQICVVSGNYVVEIWKNWQEYLGDLAGSNRNSLSS